MSKAFAEKLAKDTVAKLKNPTRWVPYVWENLGWHAEASSVCGRYKVRIHVKDNRDHGTVTGYTAWINSPGAIGSNHYADGATPRQAVARAVLVVREAQAFLASLLEGDIP